MTGGRHLGEAREETAKREALEEIGAEISNLSDCFYEFEFEVENGIILKEFVYASELDPDFEVKLSAEHDKYCWVGKEEAMKFLKYDTNKESLEKLCKILSNN